MTATVMTDTRIDPDVMMLAGVETDGPKAPIYPVSEMAKFFFARTNHWIRWLEQTEKMIYTETDGTKRQVGIRRNDKGGRIYTLGDVEEMAHALAQSGSISGSQLRLTLLLVKVQAQMHGFL